MANGNGQLHQLGRDRGKAATFRVGTSRLQREKPHNLLYQSPTIGNRGRTWSHGWILPKPRSILASEPWLRPWGSLDGQHYSQRVRLCRHAAAGSSESRLRQRCQRFFQPLRELRDDVRFGAAATQSAIRPYPQFFWHGSRLRSLWSDHYNALQAPGSERFHKWLEFLVAYTLSKTMSNAETVAYFVPHSRFLPVDK